MNKPTGKLAYAYQTIANLQSSVDALRAENEHLEEELGKTELRALKFIHQCNAHVELYRELKGERDQLRAEVEALRADIATIRADRDAFGQNAVSLRSQVEALRAENERLAAMASRLTANPADDRYWEGRWRDEAAENERLRRENADIRARWADYGRELEAELAALKAVPDGVVAWLFPNPDGTFCMDAVRHDPEYPGAQPVMTVAQHNALMADLSKSAQGAVAMASLRQPVADEREAFEAFCTDFHRGSSLSGEIHSDPSYPVLNGEWIYDDWNVQSAWATWQARAALAAPAAGRDVSALVEALKEAKYRIEQGRVWNGMGWTLTGLHASGQQKALEAIDAALAAHKAGGGQ